MDAELFKAFFITDKNLGTKNDMAQRFTLTTERYDQMYNATRYAWLRFDTIPETVTYLNEKGFAETPGEVAAMFYMIGSIIGESRLMDVIHHRGFKHVEIAWMYNISNCALDYSERTGEPPIMPTQEDIDATNGNKNPFKKGGFDIPK